MKPPVAPEEQLGPILRARGQRVTPQRLVIHRALTELGRHATAEEVMAIVEERIPGVSLPTVYTTLELLRELGLVRRVDAGPGATMYDPRPDEHHHLVCKVCGSVEDFEADVETTPALEAAAAAGFDPERAEVVVHGLCTTCRAA